MIRTMFVLTFSLLLAGRPKAQEHAPAEKTRDGHVQPIWCIPPDSLSFYDRLDRVLNGKRLNYENRDSSFNWMVGKWSIQSKGYARTGFKGKREFAWTEPVVSFLRDQNYTIYADTHDTIQLTDQTGQKSMFMPPQVILQYDVYGRVWALQPGYNNRYDWGAMISSGWEGDHMEFYGTISLSGILILERETWTKIGDNEFQILYEEKLSDGSWFKIEENRYIRILPAK